MRSYIPAGGRNNAQDFCKRLEYIGVSFGNLN